MSKAILQANNLSRNFDGKRALGDVNLCAGPGEVVALLGPNGAGKTTFLRLARGLIRPTSGQVLIDGCDARRLAATGGKGVAAVGDAWEPAGWISTTALGNLQASAGPFDRQFYEEWCERTGLAPYCAFAKLSKGQKRWVLSGLALATSPRLVLMDEPADGLDPAARLLLYQAIRQYANDYDAAVVVTTHILADIEKIADRVAIIDRGCLLLDAELETLRQEVRQVTRPLGAGPIHENGLNVLGHQANGEVDLWWLRASSPDSLSSLPYVSEIRPVGLEELYLAATSHRPGLVGQSHVAADFPPPPVFPGEGWGGGANKNESRLQSNPLPTSPGLPGEGKKRDDGEDSVALRGPERKP
jgi:ABC-2 type transport system ATP-binding protein